MMSISVLSLPAPSGYPRIAESPTLKAVEKDRNTVMLCSAEGNPDPTIEWLKDFIPVDLSDPRLKLLPTGWCDSENKPSKNTSCLIFFIHYSI